MPISGGSNSAQFTYDFGIAIAQSTVNKITRLTGATLTLASAFYALKSTALAYVDTLRENTLRFGGVLSTMKAMEQAQNRLIKGQSYFSVDDQLNGMNRLMAAGINVGKNIDWINKAAHATGKSFAEFSGMITSAIQGNSQALVDAGLMTQRATRMFDKYAANTVMRQRAILNFVKTHKGLMNAIKNDFETIQDQMLRIKAVWKGFLASIVGKPNDPQSFYGQIVSSMKMVAVSLARNMEQIKRYGYVIGQVLGWVIKQIGHFVVWIGRQAKRAVESVWKVTDDFQKQTRSLLVWLEFWKLKVVDFFKEYGGNIKTALKLLIAYKALKTVFVISNLAIASAIRYRKVLQSLLAFRKTVFATGAASGMSKVGSWLTALSTYSSIYVSKRLGNALKVLTKFERKFHKEGRVVASSFFWGFMSAFKNASRIIGAPLKSLKWVLEPLKDYLVGGGKGGFLKYVRMEVKLLSRALLSPLKTVLLMKTGVIGLSKTVALARTGFQALFTLFGVSNPVGWIILAVSLLTVLYTKSKTFRTFMNGFFKFLWEDMKLIYNIVVGTIVYALVGCKKIWGAFTEYVWNPIKGFFQMVTTKISNMWNKFKDTTVGNWIHKNIVKPLNVVFDKISKVWKWLMGGLSKVTGLFSRANTDMASNINALAKKELGGFDIAVGGNTYKGNDSTNYLGEVFKGNPLTTTRQGGSKPVTSDAHANTGGLTNMTFNDGAIQIVVQKGEGIDERILAQKIRGVLRDMQREGSIRGGA